jgi:hypothetical protein
MTSIYHFTDFANLEGIFESGALRCHRVAPVAVDVGNQSIKDNRSRRAVDCRPGGMVGDYVPFYYAPRSPMLFSIKCGNVDGVSPNQRRLVYLASSTEAVYAAGLDCVITDGNAAVYITTFSDDPAGLEMMIDWPLMRATIWRNTDEDPDRRRRRMAEFLIHDALPLDLVSEIAVMDARVQPHVAALAASNGLSIPVAIRRNWYF